MSEKLFLDSIITNKYRGLLRGARHILNDEGIKEVRKAFKMAYDASKDLPNIQNEPYINHCIAVARICIEEIGLGKTTIVCSLLFNLVNDGRLKIEDVKKK